MLSLQVNVLTPDKEAGPGSVGLLKEKPSMFSRGDETALSRLQVGRSRGIATRSSAQQTFYPRSRVTAQTPIHGPGSPSGANLNDKRVTGESHWCVPKFFSKVV